MRILATGTAGFIGSHFVREALKRFPQATVCSLDLLTYAGNVENLTDVLNNPAHTFFQGDICDAEAVARAFTPAPDVVVNFAAESHVDRSISAPQRVVMTNVVGTQTLLDAARRSHVQLFLQVSTDEVYGSLGPEGAFTEDSPLCPNSPYSASKAAADLLARSYHQTYGLPVIIARCCNNYGPNQHPEKLIPNMVTRIIDHLPLPVYGDGRQVRDWIHVLDHVAALFTLMERGERGEIYNIGARTEVRNLDLVHLIVDVMGVDSKLITHVDERPGHDRRYAMEPDKLERETSWRPAIPFEAGLRATVAWYVDHPSWWRPLLVAGRKARQWLA